ncbi:MAG: FAD-dependent thymidylate synthase, partial [Deltaproteobacteria bacterium]|nr:FAD-dependent thymidylate synthase [Deltaproteobacteria bacterium]MBW2532096.1 FAD-dependent thymidylate synthase [Deltaproteobacteria bacterium]
MRIELAGYNVDTAVLAEAEQRGVDPVTLTPEPLSAAYARISRFDKPVDELRRIARSEVAKARRSNQRIIWEMGHHSVAEHAVFNFDLIRVSRLAIEAVEHFRLCSFTEKSQRYITLDGDCVLPEEIAQAGLDGPFRQLVAAQNGLYREIYETLLDELTEAHPEQAQGKRGRSLLEGQAKEDARYVTALATEGQLGLTVNARNLELMIRRFAAHELLEVRLIGTRLYEAVRAVAPSLVLFVDACALDQATYPRLAKLAAQHPPGQDDRASPLPGGSAARELAGGSVQLLGATEDADV